MTPFEELYPFKSNFFEVDSLKLHYLDEGEGPVLLMLHGNPSWSFYYRNLIKALRGHYRIIAVDNIGHGLSDKPQDPDYYRLKNHISNVKGLLEHLKIDSFCMAVHDWGGPIGLGVAVDMPEKLERLIAFNSVCELDGKYPWQIKFCRVPFIGEKLVRHFNLFASMTATIAVGKKLSPEAKAGLLKPYDSYANRIGTYRFVMDIPFEMKHPTMETVKTIMSKIDLLKDKETLVCWGMKDICFTPAFLDGWKTQFPNHTVHTFPEAGHYVVEEESDAVIAAVMEFLKVPKS
jgi:pimeloyl-ACP methyl ester carboxylesterase